MKFENIIVGDFEAMIRAAHMSFRSFDRMDSYPTGVNGTFREGHTWIKWSKYHIGQADMKLLQNLLRAGDSDSKYLRTLDVSVEITAPAYFCAELESYKISTTSNISTIQHVGLKNNYVDNDFTFDINDSSWSEQDGAMYNEYVVNMLYTLNYFRTKYQETNDYSYYRAIRQIIPMSYNYTMAWHSNYAVLRNIWRQRIQHRHTMKEWHEDFARFIEALPYSKELIMYEGGQNYESKTN